MAIEDFPTITGTKAVAMRPRRHLAMSNVSDWTAHYVYGNGVLIYVADVESPTVVIARGTRTNTARNRGRAPVVLVPESWKPTRDFLTLVGLSPRTDSHVYVSEWNGAQFRPIHIRF